MVWEGNHAISVGRSLVGATRPWECQPGTIRGDFCQDVGRNLIHGSDGPESAAREIGLWFKEDELLSWDDHSHAWLFE